MSEKKVAVMLSAAATFAGVTYATGVQDLPAEAAEAAESKGVGTIIGESSDENSNFQPLSVQETLERMERMDFADEVLASLKFHKTEIAARFGKSKTGADDNPQKPANEAAETNKLPDDFPQRHIFAELGFASIAAIQAKSKDELVALKGVGEATAEKALAYGR